MKDTYINLINFTKQLIGFQLRKYEVNPLIVPEIIDICVDRIERFTGCKCLVEYKFDERGIYFTVSDVEFVPAGISLNRMIEVLHSRHHNRLLNEDTLAFVKQEFRNEVLSRSRGSIDCVPEVNLVLDLGMLKFEDVKLRVRSDFYDR